MNSVFGVLTFGFGCRMLLISKRQELRQNDLLELLLENSY